MHIQGRWRSIYHSVSPAGISDVFTFAPEIFTALFWATMEPRAQDSDSGLLLLHQIQTVHSSNEYIESPSTWPHPRISVSTPEEGAGLGPDDYNQDSSHSPQSPRWSTDTGPSSEQGTVGHKGETVVKEQLEKFDQEVQKELCEISTQELRFLGNLGKKMTAVEEQPRSFETKQEAKELGGSFISEQRSLGSVGELDVAIQEQPKSCDSKQEELKLLRSATTDQMHLKLEPKQEMTKQHNRKHPSTCDRCSRCKCRDCTVATPLPACWLCGRRCLCSAEALVEYTTCVCCLKALLYHCSSDDEDSSADAPFSCHKSRRCTRWSTAAAMAFVLPCLLCYGPAQGCLALCQLCHNHTHRTGCRCKSQNVTRDLWFVFILLFRHWWRWCLFVICLLIVCSFLIIGCGKPWPIVFNLDSLFLVLTAYYSLKKHYYCCCCFFVLAYYFPVFTNYFYLFIFNYIFYHYFFSSDSLLLVLTEFPHVCFLFVFYLGNCECGTVHWQCCNIHFSRLFL